MSIKQPSTGLTAAIVLIAGGLLVSPRLAHAAADIAVGQPAPAFALTDSNGKTVSLADYRGKTVVLEWSNHDCPYVKKHYSGGNMQALQADASAKGVVWLTVISSKRGNQGYVEGLEANKLTEDRKAKPAAVLLDADGKTGHAYNATATPNMFVIKPDGMLAYMGAIDDKPSSNVADLKTAKNYVTAALQAVAAGEPVKPAVTRPYGCSVKY